MGGCDQRRSVRNHRALRQHGQMTEEFNVALRAFDRRERQITDGHLQLVCKLQKTVQDRLMYRRVADNALLTNIFLSCFKLRLDQADDLPVRT